MNHSDYAFKVMSGDGQTKSRVAVKASKVDYESILKSSEKFVKEAHSELDKVFKGAGYEPDKPGKPLVSVDEEKDKVTATVTVPYNKEFENYDILSKAGFSFEYRVPKEADEEVIVKFRYLLSGTVLFEYDESKDVLIDSSGSFKVKNGKDMDKELKKAFDSFTGEIKSKNGWDRLDKIGVEEAKVFDRRLRDEIERAVSKMLIKPEIKWPN